MQEPRKKKNSIIVKDTVTVKRSNELIQAKYKATLRERKLFALAISKLQLGEYEEEPDTSSQAPKLFAVMSAGEIKEALGLSGNDIYGYLKQMSANAIQYSIFLEEKRQDGTAAFSYIAMVTKASYDSRSGLFTMEFNDILRKHTLSARHFTLMNRDILLSFKKNSTLRIYELLMPHLYKIKDKGPNTVFQFTYGLSELRFSLGLINGIDDPSVRTARDKGYSYDYIWEHILPENQPYKEWTDFQKRVLEVAKQEMQESDCCNILFDYEAVKNGKRGKVTSVKFFLKQKYGNVPDVIDWNREDIADHRPELIQTYANEENISELLDFTDGVLTREEAAAIINAAQGNMIFVTLAINAVLGDKRIKKRAEKIIEYIRNNLMEVNHITHGTSELNGNLDGQDAEEIREFRIQNSRYPVVTDMLADDFTDEEIDSLYLMASTHIKMGTIKLNDRDLWIADFIQFYYLQVKATKKATRTTPFRRLLDAIKKDYDNRAAYLDEKYQKN